MELRSFITSDTPKLTAMLHRAYAELGAVGLNFTAVDQSEATTLRRVSGGATWVIENDSDVVAAMTISWPAERALQELTASASHPGRAWLNQLAVDPAYRGEGMAKRLREVGYTWRVEQGGKQHWSRHGRARASLGQPPSPRWPRCSTVLSARGCRRQTAKMCGRTPSTATVMPQQPSRTSQ